MKHIPTREEISQLPSDGGPFFNRLIHEQSPYLLQHAANPVDWYPWGDEAFERARREDKPLFLSIGYATCHWCHVMERESFENAAIADLLNMHFVPMKVDREERPDIDEIYMNATQLITGRGGWPNSVWLTPEGKPFFAGTYFFPEDQHGRPGFGTILRSLAQAWEKRRVEVELEAGRLTEAIDHITHAERHKDGSSLSRHCVDTAISHLRATFDPQFGGFGGAPKFPPHSALELILYEFGQRGDQKLLEMATVTLDAMADGGIRDHLAGGFHRYSTDSQWLVPHFEKMLYDNAQLGRIFAEAYRLTGKNRYAQVARQLFDWVLREMTDDRGGFRSALDADSAGHEGCFYVWRRDEVIEILGNEAGEPFCEAYCVFEDGNYNDEASGQPHRDNILHIQPPITREEWERSRNERDDVSLRFETQREKLLEHRNKRSWPLLDDKVLAAWNGLMIGSMAHGARILDAPHLLQAAERAAQFVVDELLQDGRVLRTYRENSAKLNGYLEDHALLADGFLTLFEETRNEVWLTHVERLCADMLERFALQDGRLAFTASDHEQLLVRSATPYDGSVPNGNAIATRVLIRLAKLVSVSREPRNEEPSSPGARVRSEIQRSWLEPDALLSRAESIISAFADSIGRVSSATLGLCLATAMYFDASGQASIKGHEQETSDVFSADGQPLATSHKDHMSVELFVPVLRARAGEDTQIAVKLVLDDGWHVDAPSSAAAVPDSAAAEPANRDSAPGFPVRVELQDETFIQVRHIDYPPGQCKKLGDTVCVVYEKEVWIRAVLHIADHTPPDELPLVVRVRAQPCRNSVCGLPQTHLLALSIAIEG